MQPNIPLSFNLRYSPENGLKQIIQYDDDKCGEDDDDHCCLKSSEKVQSSDKHSSIHVND